MSFQVKVRMSFDTNILNVICEHIDDPKTFFNFALVCRKTRYISKLHHNNKMDEFAMVDVSHGYNNSCKFVLRRLPNGNLHGVEACYWVSGNTELIMYYNGIRLGKWWDNEYGEQGQEIIILHYKCDCTKDFENSYTNDKIGLDGVGYKLCSTITKPYNCYTCGDHNLEQETWHKFEV